MMIADRSFTLFLINLLICCVSSQETEMNCEPVPQTHKGATIWWGNITSYTTDWYRSIPLCLDSNFRIIERRCAENSWAQEPRCHTIQNPPSPCPVDFDYYEPKSICYVVTEEQTFPPKCPYKNVMGFFDYLELLKKPFIDSPVWFPAKRIDDYGVGNMVVIEPTRYYGSIVSVSIFWKESFRKDCLIYSSYLVFEAVFCNSTYRSVCAYNALKMTDQNVCSTKLSDNCYINDLNYQESKCFCINNTCETLAEFTEPYHNFLKFENTTKCNMGLYNNDSARWSISDDPIKYSYWNEDVNFDNFFGAITEDNQWLLEEERNPNCSICQETMEYQQSHLRLKLDKSNKILKLIVEHIEDLYIPEGRSSPIFCFSDTTSGTHSYRIQSTLYEDYQLVNDNQTVLNLQYSEDCPGHYWCEAFQLPSLNKISTPRILVFDEDFYGNEYATTLVVQFTTTENPTLSSFYSSVYSAIQNGLSFKDGDVPFLLRWITTVGIDEEAMTVEYLVHATSKVRKEVTTEYFEIATQLADAISETGNVKYMSELRSVSYCLPDCTSSDGYILHWPVTKVNATATPEEFCLQKDGSPVVRTCYGNFLHGAKWLEVNGSCSKHPFISPITTSLYDLLHTKEDVAEKINSLTEMTGDVSEYIAVDIHYIAEIFEQTEKVPVYLENFTKVIDHVVSSRKQTLKTSQDLLNSTDKLLYNFDVLLETYYKVKSGRSSVEVTEIITKNVFVYIFEARKSNTTGIALYETPDGHQVVKLDSNTTYSDLLQSENLTAAAYIPNKLINQISSHLLPDEPFIVAITVFLNDYLFNQDISDTRTVGNNIFGIILPKINEDYKFDIPVIYKSGNYNLQRQCAYWHYGSLNEFENIKGHWEFDKLPSENDVCMFGHTTHFALLILSDVSKDEQADLLKNYHMLYVITTIGCTLSMIGIFGILVTAVLFKPWRESKGNQILIQYSIVTAVQICLLYIASSVNVQDNYVLCVAIGAALHYNVLSQFCWMLVMAILHYQRFVLVFNQQQTWILLKSSVIGYLFPSIPVMVNIFTSSETYAIGSTGICYPTGEALIIWILVPVGCIVITNLAIFCIIIWNIFHRKIHHDYGQDYILVLKLRLIVVLFSMLGITWIFGFGAEIFGSIMCTYLFCSTASLQGFIIFLAFIVFNATARRMYWFMFKTCKWGIQQF